MRIFVTGTRGIPDIPGGVEKHCQELYPLIASHGHNVVVATRSPYVTSNISNWRGIGLICLYAPRIKSFEAITHTLLAILKARLWKPDIVHIHGIGPGLMAPLARILGMRVVVTNHGPDYERQKWGKLARFVLRFGEWTSGKFANQIIVISAIIKHTIQKRCNRTGIVIYNGVSSPEVTNSIDLLEKFGIFPGRYVLAVSRFVPEKGLHLLIEAFQNISGGDYKLVVVGDADHDTNYSRQLKKNIAKDDRIVSTGYITGVKLGQVFSHAGLFVLPSFHEGLPISLLEAMSYGLPVLVSDIPANKEVDLPRERFFRCGDVQDLKKKMERLIKIKITEREKYAFQQQIKDKYNWFKNAEQTIKVYEKVLRR